jgi:hypothetical protein
MASFGAETAGNVEDDEPGILSSVWDVAAEAAGGAYDSAAEAATAASATVVEAAVAASDAVVDTASDASTAVVEAAVAASDAVVDTASGTYDTVAQAASDTYDTVAQAASDAYDAAPLIAQDAINATTDITGAHADFDDSDGKVSFTLDTSVVKVNVANDDAKGFSASGAINIETEEYGEYGVKANVAFDNDGNVTAVGGGVTAYVPIDGVPIGGEVEGSYEQTDQGYKVSGSVTTGAEIDGVKIGDGVHFGYEDKGDGDFRLNVGTHEVVSVSNEDLDSEATLKLSADVIYGEEKGDTTYGVQVSASSEGTLFGQDASEDTVTAGVAYVTGDGGDRIVTTGSVDATVGNDALGTVKVQAEIGNESGTDATGAPIDTTTMSSSYAIDRDDLGLHVSDQTDATTNSPADDATAAPADATPPADDTPAPVDAPPDLPPLDATPPVDATPPLVDAPPDLPPLDTTPPLDEAPAPVDAIAPDPPPDLPPLDDGSAPADDLPDDLSLDA